MMAHPDGTVMVCVNSQISGSANGIQLHSFRWADADFIPQVTGTNGFRCLEIEGSAGRTTVTNGAAQDGNPIIDLAEVEQGEGGTAQAFTVDAWGRVIETRPFTAEDFEGIIACNEFAAADCLPCKRLFYAGGVLDYIEIYADEGLLEHAYTKTFVYEDGVLVSILLTRIADSEEWAKNIEYEDGLVVQVCT